MGFKFETAPGHIPLKGKKGGEKFPGPGCSRARFHLTSLLTSPVCTLTSDCIPQACYKRDPGCDLLCPLTAFDHTKRMSPSKDSRWPHTHSNTQFSLLFIQPLSFQMKLLNSYQKNQTNKPKTTIAKTSLLTNNPSLQCSWDLPTPPGAAHKSAYLTAAQHPCELSRSVVSNSLQPRGLQPARFLALWGFSRREYRSGLPFPPPGDLPDPGLNLGLLCLLHGQVDSLPTEPLDKLWRRSVSEFSFPTGPVWHAEDLRQPPVRSRLCPVFNGGACGALSLHTGWSRQSQVQSWPHGH